MKPAAKVASELRKAAVGLSDGKNCLPMMPAAARLPKM
jgi:hypothetical protein